MFVDDPQINDRYQGMNPDFVKRVWAKRRQSEREERMARVRQEAEAQRAHQEALRERMAHEKAKAEADKEAVRKLVSQYRVIEVKPQVRPAKSIIRDIAEAHGYTLNDILGVRRNKQLVTVRHMCIRAVADAKPEMSLPAIGRIFQRDHSSIIHALSKTRKEGDIR